MKKLLLSFALLVLILVFSPTSAQNTREWSIVTTYTIPGKASGLAWDGTYLYSGLYASGGNDNLIYQIDPTNGSYTVYCAGPHEDCYGLTHDGTNLWTTDRTGAYTPAIAVEFDQTGALLSQFELPATYHSGIEYDDGDFWVCCYYNPDGMVYKLDDQGTIITSFPSPNDQPWAICKENDFLWIADYNANMLYKIDQSGNLIESHNSESIKPSGVTYDGNYLWYVDGQTNTNSTLYKVDLGGSGTPQMTLPVTSHNYGIVVNGQSETWNMQVQNTGTADLDVTGVSIPFGQPVSTTFSPPQTISPGGSIIIPLTYAPTQPVALNTNITVSSTDPVNPTALVFLQGHGVVPGPHLVVDPAYHDYGNVRNGAYTRWFMEVYNDGSETLIIDDATLTNYFNFDVDEGAVFPMEIPTLDTKEIGFWFHPVEAIPYAETATITSNDPAQPSLSILLDGTGLDLTYPIGASLWWYSIEDDMDASPKAIGPIADITGDKYDDVIICSEDDKVRCLNGNSHGEADVMWATTIQSGAVYGQNGLVIIEDIDGDDYQDVVVGTAWGDRSVVALSGKTGGQIWKYETNEYGDGGWVYQVDSRHDYNADDIPDVVASTGDDSFDQGPKRIFCLDGTNGEKIWQSPLGGPCFSVISVDDFTGDGIPDVVAGASNEQESEGKVVGLDGQDGSVEWTYVMPGTSVWALAQLDDVTGDGVADVIAGDFSGAVALIDPTSGVPFETAGVGGVLILRFEVLEDVNADGFKDILVAHSGSNGIVIDGTDGTNVWLKPLEDKSWCVSATNDLDGDAINDVLIGTLYSDNYAYFLNGIDGDELKSIHYTEAIDAISSIPDIVGDGSWEMVVGGRYGQIECYSGGLDASVGLEEPAQSIDQAGTLEVFPAPFTDQLNIRFNLESPERIQARVYSTSGVLVKTLSAGRMPAGEHLITWDGTNHSGNPCSPGMYIIELITESHSESVKVTRL